MPEDRRTKLAESPHIALRPDQPPPADVDELAAISALFKGKATDRQQAQFIAYLLKMCGVGQSEYGQGEFWAFMGGRRWVATTLMAMADVRMVPIGVRRILEQENDD
jgi:hypothetical protein